MRVNIKEILADPILRKKLMVTTLIATQAREGITTTVEQAERAYEKVRNESQVATSSGVGEVRWHLLPVRALDASS